MQSRLAIPNGNNHFPRSRAQDTGQLVPISDHPDIEESPRTPAPRDILHKPNDFARPTLPDDVRNDGGMAARAPNNQFFLFGRHMKTRSACSFQPSVATLRRSHSRALTQAQQGVRPEQRARILCAQRRFDATEFPAVSQFYR
jgi:hypothetical protein